jgi:hemolysin activation/secretion protein
MALAASVLASAALSAAAQTTLGPPVTLPPVAPMSPLGAPAGGDGYVITAVVFDGHRHLSTAELDALAAGFLNRPLRLLDLEELRQRITQAYIDRGLVSSGAMIPPGALRDGQLHIRVVEGQVSRLQLKGMQGLSDDYVAARLLRPGDTLDVHRLQERFRLLLADPLFERLNARLIPDQGLGRSVIDIDVTRTRPWQLSLFAHNHQAPAVGSEVLGLDGTLRNLSGWGDALAGSVSHSRGGTSGELGWTLPLAAGVTTLGARLARAATSVVEEPLAALDIDSVVSTRELTLSHPLIDRASHRLSLGVSHNQRRNRTRLDGQPFSFVAGETTGTTEVRAWRWFQDLVLRADRHVLALRSTFVSGRNNLPVPPLLEVQPASRYRLWIGQVQASIALGDAGTQLHLRGQVQRARQHLVPLEQLSVGGRHSVRGYRENQLVRDNGHALSLELHHPIRWGEAVWQQLVLIPFIDSGRAHDRHGPAHALSSAGLGLQWRVADVEAELFVARRLQQRRLDTHGDLQDHGIHLALRWRPF